jgi:hypothetical protein
MATTTTTMKWSKVERLLGPLRGVKGMEGRIVAFCNAMDRLAMKQVRDPEYYHYLLCAFPEYHKEILDRLEVLEQVPKVREDEDEDYIE